MELQDPKMNGDLPAGAVGYRQEHEGFLPSHNPAPGRKPTEFMDFEGKTSFGMSVFNLSNAIMGSGILGLAYAMAHTGVLFFLALLLCIALLSSYSIHLLLTCAGVVGIRAYEQLGQRALGPAGKVVVAMVICLHNVGAMSSYLFIIKSELPLVIGTLLNMEPERGWFLNGNLLIIMVSVLIILPLALMRHLGYLGYTSGLSLTCMLFFLISVIYKKFHISCGVGHNETAAESKSPPVLPSQGLNRSCEAQMFTVDSQMFYTVPIMAFAFVCHHEVLPIYTELCRGDSQMEGKSGISDRGWRQRQMTTRRGRQHLGADLCPTLLWLQIRRALQQLLFPSKAFSWLRHVAIAVILLILVNVLVIYVPTIRDIFGVIGSTSAPSLIFILPSVFYLRIVPSEVEPLSSLPKIQALCFGVLGVLFMVISLGFMFFNWATGRSHVSGH
ncbi:sodium-coupled neutral amino acid transporter 5 [Myotis lucifugus]|uniref:sodium-coupled neutral amino acid transporter 5 n=1 Tax=Myotis lucifugus TaxID=59463 RepID=UPI000CCC3D56|nr:sodium-coupled neutral amino acid transporter 5 [Myotis lucifugus]